MKSSLNAHNLREDAELFAQWADDCIKSDVIQPSHYYLGTLYAFRNFARRVAMAVPPTDAVDYLADNAKREIASMTTEALREVDRNLGIQEPF